ncbi:MAG: hypothetical protein FJY73_09950 [Candidatus Eisenbacteria bacterium]|nr:hypothetical protein [Candidatus Eisenbacteria bacterium]
MRIVLSIAAPGGRAEAARWALGHLLEARGFSVGERPEGSAPYVLLVYGDAAKEPPPGVPVVFIPSLRVEFLHGAAPPPPIEIVDRAGNLSFAFPPFVGLPAGEPLWRDAHGRPAVCRPAGRREEVRFGFDLTAAAYFALSRIEERTGNRDELDRFPPASSWAVRRGLLCEPIADHLGRLLGEAIAEALHGAGRATVRVLPWPEGRPHAIALTHDEDLVIRWERRLARHAAQALAGGGRGRVAGLRLFLRDLAEGRVPQTILSQRLADRQAKLGIRSTFFFLATPSDRFARRYRVDAPPFRQLLRRLVEDGFAVGLHGGLDSYLSAEELVYERRIVSESAGCALAGIRQHYARLRVPETWEAQRAAGFRYDASLGFPDAPGFRAGTAFPIRPEGTGSFLAFPLHGMDRALAAAGLRRAEDWERWSEPVRIVNGILDILWHPYFIDTDLDPEREALTGELLEWVAARKNEAWVATLDEAAEWWEARRLAAVSGLRADERTVVRVRFGSPLRAVHLGAVPAGSEIRVESADGASDVIARGDRVEVGEAAAGAEIVLSLLPRASREGAL